MMLTLDEGERQMLLLALAQLSLDRPGFYEALWEIAQRCEAPGFTRGHSMFEQFRQLNKDRIEPMRGFPGGVGR